MTTMDDVKRQGEKINHAKSLVASLGKNDSAQSRHETIMLLMFTEMEELNRNISFIKARLSTIEQKLK